MSEPLRVAMIISRFSPSIGGTERQALLLSKELMRRGVKVDVVTQRYSSELASEEIIEGVPVHRLPPRGNSRMASGLFLLNGLRYLIKKKPHFLHAHMLATPAVMAAWARHFGGGRILVKLACSGSYGEVAVGRSSWLGRLKLSTVLSAADRLLCVTQDVAKELRDVGIPEDRLAQIPNGVDTDEFSPTTSADEKKALRKKLGLPEGVGMLFTGRLTRQKRPDLVINAFLEGAAKQPDLFLMIVGEGEEQAMLMTHAQKTGAGNRIYWMGRQSDMAPYYRAADIFVLPSEAEGMSNSLLEAMSSGLACIVSRTAMAEEMMTKSEGILVPPGDEKALAHAVDHLAADSTLRQTLSSAARERIRSRYSIQSVADRYMALYTTLAPQEAA